MFTHAIITGSIGNDADPLAEGWPDRVGDHLRKVIALDRDTIDGSLTETLVRWRKLGRKVEKIHLVKV
jgi:hypothetical protein